MGLLYSRSFVLYTNDGNGVAQISVLAPCLYNMHTADFRETSGLRYMYADQGCGVRTQISGSGSGWSIES